MSAAPTADWRLGLVLLALLGIAVTVSRVGRLGVGREQATAAIRAVVQLALVSLVIAAVLRHVSWSLGFATLMLAIATVTSTRRLRAGIRGLPLVGLAIAVGAVPIIALCLGSGVVPFNGAGVIPIAGILIGNAMTAATLTGRAVFHELDTQNAVYEGAIALGARLDQATMIVIEPVKASSLLPGLDQTRTVGLVTLPGAFVGVLLGGGTALEAGAAQVLVLIGVLAAQAVTTVVLIRLIATGRLRQSVPTGRRATS